MINVSRVKSLHPGNSVFVRPLLPATLAVMGGIILGGWQPGGFYPVLALVIACGAATGRALWRRAPLLMLPLLFCLGLGYLSIQPWLGNDLPHNHVVHHIDQSKWRVAGVVIDQRQDKKGRGRFVLAAQRLERGRLTTLPVTGKIAVSVFGPMPAIAQGDTVQVSGYLRPIRSFRNLGGFDYERFMALQGIQARLTCQGRDVVPQADRERSWTTIPERTRRTLLAGMSDTLQGWPADPVAILKALTLGERSDISPDLQKAFNRSGVAHVLAISGLHVGMVALVGFGTGFRVLTWLPFLRRRGWVHRSAAMVALVMVLLYGWLAGLSAATQRALLMTSVFLLTYWIGRRHDLLNSLAMAALVIVVLFPPALFTVSFQLSFAAVAAMLAGAHLLPRALPASTPLWRRWGSRLRSSLLISLLAILGTLPLVLRYFNLLPLAGPLTNLLVVPLTGMVVVPVGLLGIACWPLSPLLSGWCWKIALLCLTPQCWLIKKIGAFSWSALHAVTPSIIEIIVFYLLLGLLLDWRRRGPWRRVALAAILLVAIADTGYWVHQRFLHSKLRVTALDVGQGEATLLELPGGFNMVVDGGGFGDNSLFDTGERILAPLLYRKKIRTIDLVVLTHPDADHLNGLLYLVQHFTIGQIWSTNEPSNSASYQNWLQIIAERDIDHPAFQTLPVTMEKNGIIIELLGPVRDFLQRRTQEPWRDSNASAMVLRVSMGHFSLLLTADITAHAEAELLELYPPERLRSTVLFVPHHGSRTSSTMRFLQAVQPADAIISLGWQNRYNFPHSTVVKRLRTLESRIWRTDECGAIQLETNGDTYQIVPCRPRCR